MWISWATDFGSLLSELRKTLLKQQEDSKQREKENGELQTKNESLRSELSKAEKERKELAHKVGFDECMHETRGIRFARRMNLSRTNSSFECNVDTLFFFITVVIVGAHLSTK